MTVKIQKPIKFNNTCNCIVDYKELEDAILWYIENPVQSTKKIYIHGDYPAITINRDKIHIPKKGENTIICRECRIRPATRLCDYEDFEKTII